MNLDYVPNKGFGNRSMVLCWLNSALQLLIETPLPEFLSGKASFAWLKINFTVIIGMTYSLSPVQTQFLNIIQRNMKAYQSCSAELQVMYIYFLIL